ncbi:MAG TPA: hypothetical protein DE179_05340 [Oceanospirillaceae bacterium]|nr:hypothetical protein [Oceanospirillaceae bacterium]
MKNTPLHAAPVDAEQRRSIPPTVCYPIDTLPQPDWPQIRALKASSQLLETVLVPPREARSFVVPAGHLFRIVSTEGAQVGDLNLWAKDNFKERFFSGKTRALHGTHVSTGDRLWSCMPYMRPMATITDDSLDWYGWDEYGGSVHDVIGTRCDPYTNYVLNSEHYHHCCHSNLTRELVHNLGLSLDEAEAAVHDVLNVFMCTGFTQDTHQYFMKASPVRPGDYLEMLADIDLLGNLSACPGGDCGSEHSSDTTACYPLLVEIYKPAPELLAEFTSAALNNYNRSHGI